MRIARISFAIICVLTSALSGFSQEVAPGRIVNPAGLQFFTGAAYSPVLDQYLLAYYGGGQAFVLRLNPDGSLGGPQTTIRSTGVGDLIAVAYNPDRDEFFVAWRSLAGNMRGRYVSGDGMPLGEQFLIQTSVGGLELAYSTVEKNYIAIYRKGPTPIQTKFVIIDGDSTAVTKVVTKGTVQSNADSPKIACGSPTKDCLVVFVGQFGGSTKANVRGRFMSGDGTFSGGAFNIASGFENQQLPAVGYSSTHDRWLVTVEDWSTGGFPDMNAHYVDPDFTVSSRFNTTPGDPQWNQPGPITYNTSVDKFWVSQFQGGAKARDVDPLDKSLGGFLTLNAGGVPLAAAARPDAADPQALFLSREGNGGDGVHAHIIHLPPPPPSFSSLMMPDGFFGVAYAGMVPVVGGTHPLTFELVSGSLAPPLSLAADGTVSGIPNAIGSFGTFRIRVTDDDGRSAEADLTHDIKLSPPTLIGPTAGTSDTTPTFMWNMSPGATSYRLVVNILGGGTVLDESGITDTFFTPSVSSSIPPGFYEWKVSATDGVNTSPFSAPLTLEIDVNAPEAVVLTGGVPGGTSTLPDVVVDSFSSQKASNGLFAANLVDENVSTDWQTAGTSSPQDEWAILDLAGDFTVSTVRLRSDSTNATRFPLTFEIQLSLDKSTWTTVHSETGFLANVSTWYDFAFTPTLAHYVRILVTDENNYFGTYYTRIAEIEVIEESPLLGTLEVCWDAPPDDDPGGGGQVSAYDLRYDDVPAASFNYAGAMQASGEPIPAVEGTNQCFTLDMLDDETLYSVALTSVDDAGNISAISNILEVSTRGIPPTTVTMLQALNPGKTTVDLTWPPPTDVGSGVASYDFRYSLSPITPASFESASEIDGEPIPGSFEDGSMTATNLPTKTLLYFAMRSVDGLGNYSAMSNVVSIATLDGKAPGQITDLVGFSGGSSLIDQTPLVASDASGERVDKGYLKGNVVDLNPATIWMSPGNASATATTFITINLGSIVNVAQVSLQADNGNAVRFPRDIQIQVSDAPTSGFVTIHSVADLVAAPSQWFIFDVTPTMGQYVRINVTEMNQYTNGLHYASIAEVKVSRLEVLAGGFVLQWTAPANDFDSMEGSASSYEIKYSSDDIVTDMDFASATPVDPGSIPAPQPFGFTENLSLSGFGPEEVLFVAMTATDDNMNTSVRSNTVKVSTPGTPPDPVAGLTITGATGASLTLQFIASADDAGDAGSGPVQEYDVRCSTSMITGIGDFLAAPSFGGPAPLAPGETQTFTVMPLANQTMYHCGALAIDDAENASTLSTIVSGSTLDELPPDPLSSLAVDFSVSSLSADVDSVSSERVSKGYFGSNVVDKNLSTFWMSEGVTSVQDQWIVLDLDFVQTIGEVRLRSDDVNAVRFPKSFSIQTSTDGAAWTTVNTQTDFVAAVSTWYSFPFADQSAQFVRILVTDMNQYTNGQYYSVIAEVEIYAPGGPQIQALLSWNGTGDDGLLGVPFAYDIRYSTDSIDEGTFGDATPSAGVYPTPLGAGIPQSFTIPDALAPATLHYFAIKTLDEAGNSSVTVVSGTTPDVDGSPVDLVAPDPVTNLDVSFAASVLSLGVDSVSDERIDKGYLGINVVDTNPATIWMTNGVPVVQTQWIIVDLGAVQTLSEVQLLSDNGNAVRFPKNFEVQLSTDKVTWNTVSVQTNFVATPSTWYSFPFADAAGQYIRIFVTDMNKYTNNLYYTSFAEISAVASGTTFQGTLTWNASGDDADVGQALAYDIRYDTDPIFDETSFDNAMEVDGESSPKMSGAAEAFIVPAALNGGTLYYFAIKTLDEVGNFSLTFVNGTTPVP